MGRFHYFEREEVQPISSALYWDYFRVVQCDNWTAVICKISRRVLYLLCTIAYLQKRTVRLNNIGPLFQTIHQYIYTLRTLFYPWRLAFPFKRYTLWHVLKRYSNFHWDVYKWKMCFCMFMHTSFFFPRREWMLTVTDTQSMFPPKCLCLQARHQV